MSSSVVNHPAPVNAGRDSGREPQYDALPTLVSAGLRVPLVSGESVPYANFDYAASTPCLDTVWHAVQELVPWYASVHRGAGFASQVCTELYEQAREVVRRFVGAPADATTVFTRNTTDAMNLLARTLPKGTTVWCFDSDHHAAVLPWRDSRTRRVALPSSPAEAVALLDEALTGREDGPGLVVITAASNVTGELWPVAELAEVAHRHGVRCVLDAAQLAAHGQLRAEEWGVDWIVLSGHKLYAPFGAGALVGRRDWLEAAEPYLVGGGATRLVSDGGDHLDVDWSAGPGRHEAGSPNVVGVHALSVACQSLPPATLARIAEHEQAMVARVRHGLGAIPGVRLLSMWHPENPRVGVVSFAVDGADLAFVATALSAEHGIGVRDGMFCAHIGTGTILRRCGSEQTGRALRASIGLGTTGEHVDRLLHAVDTLARHSPRWNYRLADGRWAPDPDPRPVPAGLRPMALLD
ncbi:aminotransferase class V-fold PLP-dependent enzyme [Solihabitans fulvus]|uniref:Aminotransferase class V-fold PLP-dependent enzyme n=1 Tax=Solihabitans fulvus TaxID=1892852 RepID=A0A5B2WR05_9PSEU|nr:aminotransferase class V-fold PLP-dependent enzyme [Solihabitans fulvus]KAA2253935.1 aminotransferase class V-fold PLP-dependent enzyme [Solihabitans fulvus]